MDSKIVYLVYTLSMLLVKRKCGTNVVQMGSMNRTTLIRRRIHSLTTMTIADSKVGRSR